MELLIGIDDPQAPDVRAVIERHLAFNRSVTPPEGVFALEVEGLTDSSVTFVSARRDDELLGIAALRQIDACHAEVKSMHTVAAARGQGVARRLLDHLLAMATERGCTRVSLETGRMDAYEPARALYASAGFEPCGPFADYVVNETSAFMTRELP